MTATRRAAARRSSERLSAPQAPVHDRLEFLQWQQQQQPQAGEAADVDQPVVHQSVSV